MRRFAMLVVVGLLAACASEADSGSSDDGGEPPEETTTTEDAERDFEADQELADEAVLTIDDLPVGFEEQPEDDEDDADDSDDVLDESFADCMGISVGELNDDEDEPQASSTFATEGDAEVNSEVTVYATEAEVVEDLELVKSPDSLDCFADAMNEVFAATDEDVGEITVEDLGVEDLGEDAFGLGVTVPFAVETGERVLYLDLVLIQQGRTAISMGYQAFDVPFDVALGYDLADTVVNRVPADA